MFAETQLERFDTPHGVFLSYPGDLITKHLRRFGAHQKIDAEGMDADVLLSCENLLVKIKPLIYIEVGIRSLLKH